MKEQEEQSRSFQDLVLSVKELAINMTNMMEEQKKQNERLQVLEQKPAKKWDNMQSTILATIASGIIGTLVGALMALIN